MPQRDSQPKADESPLFERVEQWSTHKHWQELDQQSLAEITRQEGIDFSTTLFYSRLRQSAEHRLFIQEIANPVRETNVELNTNFRVGIVPGGCHQESLDSKECLRLVHNEIKQMGCDVAILPTTSFGSLYSHAELIRQWLAVSSESDARSPIILVSLSKGGAEVKLALQDDPQAFRNVRAWVDVSGLVDGSQWVTWLLDRKISSVGARIWAWYWGYPFSTLKQLRRGQNETLDFDVPIPNHLTAIRIVGFPLTGDLDHPYTKRSFQRLEKWGPNDGMGVMLGDLTRWRGRIFPVWRADHFLRPSGTKMCDYVRPVLQYVTKSAIEKSHGET